MLLRPKCFLKKLWLSPDDKHNLSGKGQELFWYSGDTVTILQFITTYPRWMLLPWLDFSVFWLRVSAKCVKCLAAARRRLVWCSWLEKLSVVLYGNRWAFPNSTSYFPCIDWILIIISLFTTYSDFMFRGTYHIAMITDVCKI